jgi:CheY-like chemotaxis protein
VSTIAVTPLIEEAVKLLKSTLPKTIQIEQNIDVEMDVVSGDPTQIHQVIMNLCTNAYHAMRERGGVLSLSLQSISLEAPRQCRSLSIPPGEYLKLGVSDTGCGITPQICERIFDPYFTTKEKTEGSGLGLSVTLGILKAHKGLIEVRSTVGEGTRFDLYFPVAPYRTMEEPSPSGDLPTGDREKILVVDDEAFFLDVVRDSLEHLGYRVIAHQSSLKALDLFKGDPEAFDLVVTDQTMPEMTGIQLITEIRKTSRDIPIILCTGYSETVTEQSARHYGITRFLMKPVNAKALAWAVREALGPGKGKA